MRACTTPDARIRALADERRTTPISSPRPWRRQHEISPPRVCRSSGRATPSLRRDKRAAIPYDRNPAGRHLSSAENCSDNRGQLSDHTPTFAHRFRRQGDPTANGRKQDHGVQLFGRRFVRPAGPCRAKVARGGLGLRIARARESEHLAPPPSRYRRHDMRHCAEAIQAKLLALALLNAI
jgi:hypothetical protein